MSAQEGYRKLAAAVVQDAWLSAKSVDGGALARFQDEIVPRIARMYFTVYAENVRDVLDHMHARRRGEVGDDKWPKVMTDNEILAEALKRADAAASWKKYGQPWLDMRWLGNPAASGVWSELAGLDHDAVASALAGPALGSQAWRLQDAQGAVDRARYRAEAAKRKGTA